MIRRGSSLRLTSAPMSFDGVMAVVAVGVMTVRIADAARRRRADAYTPAHRDDRGHAAPYVKRLPARICARPRVLFVGINPSLRSAEVGHHFAGPGNPFWRLLHAAKLIPESFTYEDDVKLPSCGFALTNICRAANARRLGAHARRVRYRTGSPRTADRASAAGRRRLRRRDGLSRVLRAAGKSRRRPEAGEDRPTRGCSCCRTRAG